MPSDSLPATTRRILSLWLPRLAAERILRREGAVLTGPFAVVRDVASSLSRTGFTHVLFINGEDYTCSIYLYRMLHFRVFYKRGGHM